MSCKSCRGGAEFRKDHAIFEITAMNLERVSKMAAVPSVAAPQGLKPVVFAALFGTTEVVP
jgi:hypothetical protein